MKNTTYRERRISRRTAHVRSTHIHLVVCADARPEKVLSDLKAYASRRLKEANLDPSRQHRWSRHGSLRYLWTGQEVDGAIHYVLHRQGEPMAVYQDGHRSLTLAARLYGQASQR